MSDPKHYRTKDEWFKLVQECRKSGLSDAQWCALNGISRHSLNTAKGVETSSKDWRKLNEDYGYDEVVAIFDSFHNPMLRSVALNQLRILQDMNKVIER